MSAVEGLYIGKINPLPPDGERSAIFKDAVETVAITPGGLVGDNQADRRFHGGPDKAVHQFSRRAYATIWANYPHLTSAARPGSFGENLSTTGMADTNVYIGDIYRLGSSLLQVSEPRRPCWKINRKFDEEQLSIFVEQHCITGWYLRVLDGGTVTIGDQMILQDREKGAPSIATFTHLVTQHRPEPAALARLLDCTSLSETWQRKLHARVEYLSRLKD
ncbi:MAG: MOSC domain-containing protein [Gammaproteobacteria bacterium]